MRWNINAITWCLFWRFRSRHLVDYRIDKSSVCRFTVNDEPNIIRLLALKIVMEESHCQGIGRLVCNAANPWHSGGQHCRSTKGNPTTMSFIASLLDAWGRAVPHSPPLIPPFLFRWVKTTLACYTSLVIFTSEYTKSGWDTWYRYHQHTREHLGF